MKNQITIRDFILHNKYGKQLKFTMGTIGTLSTLYYLDTAFNGETFRKLFCGTFYLTSVERNLRTLYTAAVITFQYKVKHDIFKANVM